jgi:rSAM/selenodomain-associated transferase 1
MSTTPTVAVLAKAPAPGRVKTRLCPPCTPVQAADLARAALEDTLAAASAVRGARLVLVLDGDPSAWIRHGLEVIPQRGGGLDQRLAAAFDDLGGPTLLVGMDTPQVTATLLEASLASLLSPGVDAVLGPAPDGGYWAVGLREPDSDAFHGVPMSTDATGAAQVARLRDRGRSIVELPSLRDVDGWSDAVAVAAAAPATSFAAAVAAVELARAAVRTT